MIATRTGFAAWWAAKDAEIPNVKPAARTVSGTSVFQLRSVSLLIW
jgi:hypothetical protein